MSPAGPAPMMAILGMEAMLIEGLALGSSRVLMAQLLRVFVMGRVTDDFIQFGTILGQYIRILIVVSLTPPSMAYNRVQSITFSPKSSFPEPVKERSGPWRVEPIGL